MKNRILFFSIFISFLILCLSYRTRGKAKKYGKMGFQLTHRMKHRLRHKLRVRQSEEKKEEKDPKLITSIETELTSPPIKRCTQSIAIEGKFILDTKDVTVQNAGFLASNVYTVSLFEKKGEQTLITSIDWVHVNFPLKKLDCAPNCVKISSKKEGKEIPFCFPNSESTTDWLSASEIFKMCRAGIDPSSFNPLNCARLFLKMKNEKLIKEKMGKKGGSGGKKEEKSQNALLEDHDDLPSLKETLNAQMGFTRR